MCNTSYLNIFVGKYTIWLIFKVDEEVHMGLNCQICRKIEVSSTMNRFASFMFLFGRFAQPYDIAGAFLSQWIFTIILGNSQQIAGWKIPNFRVSDWLSHSRIARRSHSKPPRFLLCLSFVHGRGWSDHAACRAQAAEGTKGRWQAHRGSTGIRRFVYFSFLWGGGGGILNFRDEEQKEAKLLERHKFLIVNFMDSCLILRVIRL